MYYHILYLNLAFFKKWPYERIWRDRAPRRTPISSFHSLLFVSGPAAARPQRGRFAPRIQQYKATIIFLAKVLNLHVHELAKQVQASQGQSLLYASLRPVAKKSISCRAAPVCTLISSLRFSVTFLFVWTVSSLCLCTLLHLTRPRTVLVFERIHFLLALLTHNFVLFARRRFRLLSSVVWPFRLKPNTEPNYRLTKLQVN
jgi:hypothetical protein